MNHGNEIHQLMLLPREIRECPEVLASIRQCIENDPQSLNYYAMWMEFEAALHWTLVCDPPELPEEMARIGRWMRWSRYVQTAMTMSAGILVLIIGLQVWQGITARADSLIQSPLLAARMVSKGQVLRSGRSPGRLGAIFPGEELSFRQGELLVQMGNGTELAVTGPADLKFLSGHEVDLRQGKLYARVPPPSRGFTVLSRQTKIVDLGTVFGVHIQPDQGVQVHVLEGTVSAASPLFQQRNIQNGEAHEFADDGHLRWSGPAQEELFEGQLALLQGITEVTGPILVLDTPPKSVQSKGLIAMEGGVLFRETIAVQLSEPLLVIPPCLETLSKRSSPELVTLPAGTKVTSYLIHSEDPRQWPVHSRITFDGEIAGFALTRDQLDRTDQQFGHPGTQYPSTQYAVPRTRARGAVLKEEGDQLTTSADRKTMDVVMNYSGSGFDQIRVFVFANE